MSAVFSFGHSVADFEHVGIIPVTRSGVISKWLLFVDYSQYAPTRPRAVIFFTVPAGRNIACSTPQVTNVPGPLPWLVFAPLANTEHHRPTRRSYCVAHRGVCTDRGQTCAVTPIIFQI